MSGRYAYTWQKLLDARNGLALHRIPPIAATQDWVARVDYPTMFGVDDNGKPMAAPDPNKLYMAVDKRNVLNDMQDQLPLGHLSKVLRVEGEDGEHTRLVFQDFRTTIRRHYHDTLVRHSDKLVAVLYAGREPYVAVVRGESPERITVIAAIQDTNEDDAPERFADAVARGTVYSVKAPPD